MSKPALALITGASSGIGLEFARIHARRGGDLALVARSAEKLEQIATQLRDGEGVAVHVFPKDLGRPGAAEALHTEVEAAGLEVGSLVNNAGFGGHGAFHERAWEQDRAMIELNVTALTGLTRLFLPGMVARRSGHVLNVASVAGFLPGPLQAVYYATKAYVISFTEAIANELKGTGVTATVLCPGATKTGFADAADLEGSKLFEGRVATAEAVAACGYRAMVAGKPLVVEGPTNKLLAHLLIPLTPRAINTAISRRLMEKR